MSKKNRGTFKTKTATTKTPSAELGDQELQQVSGGYTPPTSVMTSAPPHVGIFTMNPDSAEAHNELIRRPISPLSPTTFKP